MENLNKSKIYRNIFSYEINNSLLNGEIINFPAIKKYETEMNMNILKIDGLIQIKIKLLIV